MPNLRRVLVLGAVLSALFVPAGADAASAAPLTGYIVGGLLELSDSYGGNEEYLGLGLPCYPYMSDVEGDVTDDTFALVFDTVDTFRVGVPGVDYVAVLSGAASGTRDGVLLSGEATLTFDIYVDDVICDPSELVCAGFSVTVALEGYYANGSMSFIADTIVPLDTFYQCDAPFSTYFGGGISISGGSPLTMNVDV